jgi:phage gp46-like protein
MTAAEDIRIIWDSDLMEGDISFDPSGQDLEHDSGLETAVLISLFTNRRADDDDVLPDQESTEIQGWWGDLASPEIEGDQIGSKLWLLGREKTTEDILARTKLYVEEALQWLIDDGVAAKIEVETDRSGTIGTDVLALSVKIYEVAGRETSLIYKVQWEAQALR